MAAVRITPPGSAEVSAEEVMAALSLILASDAFANVKRPSLFLRHVVESTLRGEQTLLKETLLGIEVFGREPSWNTRIDPVVRQEAARLRKRLARYYEAESSEVRIELPVGTYVPRFIRVTSQTADAEIIRIEPPVEVTADAPRKPRRYGWLAFAATILLLGGLGANWRVPASRAVDISPSIVVLPFTNLSTDPANEYFADGLTDEVTEELVHLNSLRVVARTSARVFKGTNADVREVGRQLNVSYVLEGSAERSGDQIRISTHLERASDGSHVWSQTYNRPAKDLLTVQSELATAIAGSLQAGAGHAVAARHVPNLEAHDLYERGSFEIDNATPESISRAEQDLRRAVQIDPEYAMAWNGLGAAKYNLAAAYGRNHTQAEITEAKQFYHKALGIDPALSEARANLGFIALTDDWDWAAAERELQLASRERPNPAAEMQYGLLLAFRGRFSEADRRLESARSLDPVDSAVSMDIILVRYWESRFPEAIALARQVLERYPNLLGPQMMLNLSYIEEGHPELALENLRSIEKRFPPIRVLEVMALSRSGHREEGLRLIHQLESEYEQDPGVFRQWFALAWASLGDHPQTLKWLQRSADLHEFQVLNLAVNPAFAEMRNDPGFQALVKRTGLT